MALLTPIVAARTGNDLTGVAAGGGGDTFENTGKEVLHIFNGDSGAHTVTVALQKQIDGQSATARAVSVPAGKSYAIGPFPTGIYNDADDLVHVSYDGVTSVKVAVLKVAPA